MKKLSLIFVVFLSLISCEKEEPYQYANLNFNLTATPSKYENVIFDIQSIKIYFESLTESGKWITINNLQKGSYNLSNYINGSAVSIASTPIVQGKISKITIGLGQTNSITTAAGTINLDFNSTGGYEVDIILDAEIGYGAEKTIFLDFDLSNSIKESTPGKLQIQPSVRAYTEDNSGSIEGIISPAESYPVISANFGGLEIKTKNNDDGYFCIMGLPEGEYNLTINPLDSYISQLIQNISVKLGSKSNIGIILLENNEYIAKSISGDLNLDPSLADNELFTMTTPKGIIDINLLQAEGDVYTYLGTATLINIMPKAQGEILNIDGNEIALDKNTRYTFQSKDTPMNVHLRNTKNGNGNWWIEISGDNIGIIPIPGIKK
ncbi:MAG: DUF4382 domain-containing protein [Bacteroidales bacterium]|nr:DUF4382 domain-containing protein [Bacteroidales bacterium]